MSAAYYGKRPACMSASEYDAWFTAAKDAQAAGGGGRRYADLGVRPCRDCTRAFAAWMQAEDRCDGVPGRYSEMTADEQRAYNRLTSQRARDRKKEDAA